VAIDTTLHDVLLNIISTVSKNEALNSNLLKISPNPFSTEGVLNIEDPELQNGHLTIMDVTGKVVQQANLRNSKTYLIRREGLGSGLYFVFIRYKDKALTRRFLID
jgi:Secretion system C-terminal sorting domain